MNQTVEVSSIWADEETNEVFIELSDGRVIVFTLSEILRAVAQHRLQWRLNTSGWTTGLKGRKIRVNVVSSGPIDTPSLSGLAEIEEQRKRLCDHLASAVPLRPLGKPEEIAKAAVFLVSDDASYTAGIELFVDGGSVQV